jgi:cyclohexadienyl dehydratase
MKDKLQHAHAAWCSTRRIAREQEVQSGRADVFMTDFPYSQPHASPTAEWARLVSPPTTYHITPYAYAMKPGDDAWYARIERFMSDVKRDGRLMAAAARNKLEPIVVR